MQRTRMGTPFVVDGSMHAPPARINIGSADASIVVDVAQKRMAEIAQVRSLAGAYRYLDDLARTTPIRETTLDLVGAATAQGLLQLGGSIIDGASLAIVDLFARMADERLLQRLRIHEVRLVGCRTGVELAGQDTIRRLAQILRVRVLGTTGLVYGDHFGDGGFDPTFDSMLVDDGGVTIGRSALSLPSDAPRARPFTLDALPIVRESDLKPVAWPRFVVPRTFDPRSLPAMVRANEGRDLSGLLTLPRCELLISARRKPNAEEHFHVLEILFNWAMVRVFSSDHPTGAIYPIVSPSRFVRIFIALPQLHR